MAELIDRQAILEIAMSYCPDDDGSCSKAGHDIREMLDEIEALPTVETEPVRHGRWENGECTNCKRNLLDLCGGEDYDLAMYAECDAVFCPFCGARMDGGVENGY